MKGIEGRNGRNEHKEGWKKGKKEGRRKKGKKEGRNVRNTRKEYRKG
jgi:hypothetical protein